jgi:hypothetical protein
MRLSDYASAFCSSGTERGAITEGPVFRCIRAGDRLSQARLSDRGVGRRNAVLERVTRVVDPVSGPGEAPDG